MELVKDIFAVFGFMAFVGGLVLLAFGYFMAEDIDKMGDQ